MKGSNVSYKKPKIAFYLSSDIRSYAGIEKYVIPMSNMLDGDVEIYSPSWRSNTRLTAEEIQKMLKGKVFYYKAVQLPIVRENIPLSISGIRALIKMMGADVIYSTEIGFIPNMLLITISKLLNKKFVLGLHDALFFSTVTPFRRILIRFTPNMHVQNSFYIDSLHKLNYKGTVYRNPVILNASKIAPNKIKVNRKAFVVLYTGRLSVEQKGIDLLVDSIKKVLSTNKEIEFHIVGSGNDGEGIVSNVSSKYPKNVKRLGFLSEKELHGEYQMASLFAFPSRYESFGLALAEAQCNGLPAIAFDIPGLADLIDNQNMGVLVKQFDTGKYAQAILKYYGMWKRDKATYLRLKEYINHRSKEKYEDSAMVEGHKKIFMTQQSAKEI